MQLLAVRRANSLHYIRLELLNPKRKAFERDITERMVARYQFLKFPQTYEDHTTRDGVAFSMGVFDGVAVEEIRIFHNGFFIVTGESTDVAEALFHDLMTLWAEAGAEYRPELVTGVSYASTLIVRSEVDFARLTRPVNGLLAATFGERPANFDGVTFSVGKEIDLRIERHHSDGAGPDEYWSQGPLRTAPHFEFLQEFERLLQ